MDGVNDMILLAEVAETGSFTRAGGRLGMPKSTVSQRIAQLEARLGLRLLNRSTRHVSLTGSGQVYLEYCRRVRAEVSAADMAMTNLKEQPVGTLKITCPEVTASYFMPTFLHGFTTQFPRIAVELIATNRHLDIIRERIDFAFRVGTTTGQDLIVRRVSSIKRVLVSAPVYLAAGSPLREPTDLLHHRCLVHDAQPEWVFSSDDTPIVMPPPAAATSDSMGFLLQSCIAGGGVALLPAYVCQPSVAVGRLVELLPGWEIPPYEMMLIFPNLKNQSKAQAAFRYYVNTFDFSAFAVGR
ncbi:MAG: LysR family transcriptional regulator [Mesorhizobium sp.]|nr:MAG: LysR family transcriptional regulator [Mesorhizobium sp.]RWP30387.1 MAG: LysR family transcriptional regulator [Mesorhizobium sp.]